MRRACYREAPMRSRRLVACSRWGRVMWSSSWAPKAARAGVQFFQAARIREALAQAAEVQVVWLQHLVATAQTMIAAVAAIAMIVALIGVIKYKTTRHVKRSADHKGE